MYTIDDIREIAIQIERNGEKTYRTAGKETTNPDLANFFFWLADQEQRHALWFASLKTNRNISSEYREMEAMGQSLLRDMVKAQPFSLNTEQLKGAADLIDVISQSLKLEQDTIIFYDMLQAVIDDDKASGQLNRIINEEHEHVKALEKLKKQYVKGQDIGSVMVNALKS